MATVTWNSFSGAWNTGANWVGGSAPEPGDTAVIGGGTVTNGTPDMTDVAIVNETISLIAAFELKLNNTSFDSETRILFNNPGLITIADFGTATNSGFMGDGSATGEVDLYLVPSGGSVSFVNAGTISLSENSKVLGSGTLANSGLLQIRNLVSVPIGFSVMGTGASIANTGTIAVDGSLSSLPSDTQASFGAMSGGGACNLTFGQVTFSGAVSGGETFNFEDGHGLLKLSLGSTTFGADITGFRSGDTIDLGLSAADNVNFAPGTAGAPGTLTVSNSGTTVASLLLSGSYETTDFTLSNVGSPGASDFVVTTTAAPCFAAGTRILTARGEVAVEALRIGDRLVSAFGRMAPVVWLGHRRVDCRRHPRPAELWPVRIEAGAFGDDRPFRALWLSPDHAVYVNGGLVPIRYLVNGASIAQVPVDEVTYWHVELPAHEVILAEGLAAESYLDTGNRGAFENGGAAPMHLHADYALRMWEAKACAKLLLCGAVLTDIRRRLLARTAALGHGWTDDAGLRVLADGCAMNVAVAGATRRVSLPPGARGMRIVSRAWVPAHALAEDSDYRRLGVAIAGIRLDGAAVGLEDARLGRGWHAAEAAWRWTDGDARLAPAGARELAFDVVLTGRYWRERERAGAELRG
jgi:hypothetical protein